MRFRDLFLSPRTGTSRAVAALMIVEGDDRRASFGRAGQQRNFEEEKRVKRGERRREEKVSWF